MATIWDADILIHCASMPDDMLAALVDSIGATIRERTGRIDAL